MCIVCDGLWSCVPSGLKYVVVGTAGLLLPSFNSDSNVVPRRVSSDPTHTDTQDGQKHFEGKTSAHPLAAYGPPRLTRPRS